jgi:hypothetical protein
MYVGPGAHTMPKGVVAAGASSLPGQFALHQNYPNPFNATTNIRYQVPADDHVRLKIFNTLGQEVRTLVDSRQVSGEYQIRWDGRNDHGSDVSTGIYFYSLRAGEFTDTRKMVLLK